MERTLRGLTPPELARLYQDELMDTFPSAELKPLWAMEDLVAKERYDPLGLFEGEELLGYALLWTDESGYALLDYLGVTSARRNGGLGAEILQKLGEYYVGWKGIFGESEAPGDPNSPGYQLRCRRLGFYDRCGLRRVGYDCAMFGVSYYTLFYPVSGEMPPEEEILQAHRRIYKKQFTAENYEKYVQLPLEPGEKVKPFSPWVE